jgi:hypothetical protein
MSKGATMGGAWGGRGGRERVCVAAGGEGETQEGSEDGVKERGRERWRDEASRANLRVRHRRKQQPRHYAGASVVAGVGRRPQGRRRRRRYLHVRRQFPKHQPQPRSVHWPGRLQFRRRRRRAAARCYKGLQPLNCCCFCSTGRASLGRCQTFQGEILLKLPKVLCRISKRLASKKQISLWIVWHRPAIYQTVWPHHEGASSARATHKATHKVTGNHLQALRHHDSHGPPHYDGPAAATAPASLYSMRPGYSMRLGRARRRLGPGSLPGVQPA